MTDPHPRLPRVYVVEWERTHYGKPETTTKLYRQRAAANSFRAKLEGQGYAPRVWTVDVDPTTWGVCIVQPWGLSLPPKREAS